MWKLTSGNIKKVSIQVQRSPSWSQPWRSQRCLKVYQNLKTPASTDASGGVSSLTSCPSTFHSLFSILTSKEYLHEELWCCFPFKFVNEAGEVILIELCILSFRIQFSLIEGSDCLLNDLAKNVYGINSKNIENWISFTLRWVEIFFIPK